MGKTIGRTLEDAKQKALGRVPLRYDFEVVPKAVDDLPNGLSVCSVAWEKGDKISFTNPVQVDSSSSSASFQQKMCQMVTIYRENNVFLPKEYTFKVQTLAPSLLSSEATRRTIAKAKLDLSQFCSNSAQVAEHEHTLKLHPKGRLHLTIKTKWLQHLKHASTSDSATDTITELESTEDLHGLSRQDSHTSNGLNRSSFTWASRPGRSSDSGSDTSSTSAQHVSSNPFGSYVSHVSSAEPAVPEPSSIPRGEEGSSSGGGGSSPMKRGHRRNPSAPTILEVSESVELPPEGEQPSRSPSAGAAFPTSPTPGVISPGGAVAGGEAGGVGAAAAGGVAGQQITSGAGGRPPVGGGALSWGSGVWSNLKTTVNAGLSGQRDLAASPTGTDQDGRAGSAAAGPEGMVRSLSSQLPSWLWPVGRNAVKDMTTDQIMQAIQAGNDVPKLQMLARGLLAERNDWRFRATQVQRESVGKDEQLAALQTQLAAANEKCDLLQGQVAQLRESDLINELVKAKVEHAQSEESAVALRGQLMKAQERGRQLAAKLTKLESEHVRLLHEQWAAQQSEGQGWPAGTEK